GSILPCWSRATELGLVTSMSYHCTLACVPAPSLKPGECSASRWVTPPTVRRAVWYMRVPSPVRPPRGIGSLRQGLTVRLVKVNVGAEANGLSMRTSVIWLPGEPGSPLELPGVSTNHIGPPGEEVCMRAGARVKLLKPPGTGMAWLPVVVLPSFLTAMTATW